MGVIGGKGSGPARFAEALRGVGVDRAGLVYAVGDRQVKVFDAEGKLRRRWPTSKPGYCVAIDEAGAVYVGEVGLVEQFDALGKPMITWRDGDRLKLVTAIGFFGGSVLVADAGGRCIRRYDSRGKWLGDIGRNNNTRGFMIPNGHLDFAVDDGGIIHAANPGKHRVERYAMTGELLGHFGRFGARRPEDFPGCCNPTNLTLTERGHVVVTEKAGPRMKVYDAAGKLLALVGPEAFDPNCKNMDVAADSRGRVYIVDTVRLHICVFAPDGTDEMTPTRPASAAAKGAAEP